MTASCHAQTGQWYLREDTAEMFQVTGYDELSRTIEIQTADGDLDEFDEESWQDLPLTFAEPPRDLTGPVDDVELEPQDSAGDSSAVRLTANVRESWEDLTAEDEIDALTEESVPEDFASEQDEESLEDARDEAPRH